MCDEDFPLKNKSKAQNLQGALKTECNLIIFLLTFSQQTIFGTNPTAFLRSFSSFIELSEEKVKFGQLFRTENL